MTKSPAIEQDDPLFSRRRLGVAGAAAFLGCAACCAIPLLAAAGISSASLSGVVWLFRPGSELMVGGAAFVLVLTTMALVSRVRKNRVASCGATCESRGRCCDRGASPERA